jgi:hypothetical protein
MRSQLNGLRATEAKGRIPANQVELTALLPLIRQAMRETDLSQKAMALNAGQPESVISDGLNGRRNFAAEWWWAQPDTFLIRFLDLVTEARQLTPEHVSAVRRRRIVELIDLLLTEVA